MKDKNIDYGTMLLCYYTKYYTWDSMAKEYIPTGKNIWFIYDFVEPSANF